MPDFESIFEEIIIILDVIFLVIDKSGGERLSLLLFALLGAPSSIVVTVSWKSESLVANALLLGGLKSGIKFRMTRYKISKKAKIFQKRHLLHML